VSKVDRERATDFDFVIGNAVTNTMMFQYIVLHAISFIHRAYTRIIFSSAMGRHPPGVMNVCLIYPSRDVPLNGEKKLLRLSTSPPASNTAFMAAWLNFLLFSAASFSRRALVLLLPLGATPVRILRLSCGVKLTKPTLPLGMDA
jgi:hypothetical protein